MLTYSKAEIAATAARRLIDGLPYMALALIALFWCYPYRFSFFATDEGLYYFEAWKIRQGDVIYRDFFEFIGPGVFFFIRSIWAVFGMGIGAVRNALFLLLAVETGLVYWLAKRVLNSHFLAGIPALAYLFLAKQSSWWAIDHHVLTHFLVVMTAFILIHAYEKGGRWKIWLVGLIGGTAFCTTQHTGGLLIATTFFWVLATVSRRCSVSRWRAVLLFASGAAIPVGALFSYLAAHYALADACECTYRWVLEGYYATEEATAYFDEGRSALLSGWKRFPSLLSLRLVFHTIFIGYLPVVALMTGFLRICYRLVRRRKGEHDCVPAIVWTMAATLFASVLSSPNTWCITQNSTLTYIFAAQWLATWHLQLMSFDVLPRMKLAIEKLPGAEEDGIRLRADLRWSSEKVPFGGLVLPLCCLFLAVLTYGYLGDHGLAAYQYVVRSRPFRSYLETPMGRLWSLDAELKSDVEAVRDLVSARTTGRDKIFVYNWSAYLYVVTARDGATRYSDTWPRYHTERQVAEIVRVIENSVPAVIIEDRMMDRLVEARDPRFVHLGIGYLERDPVGRAVRAYYTPILTNTNFTVYVRKTS